MLTVTTVCRYQAAFFSFIPTHSAQSHRIPCAFPRTPCSPSRIPNAFRAVPRIPAQSRAFPRIPVQSRAVPRIPAQSDKLVIMCTNFQRVASPSMSGEWQHPNYDMLCTVPIASMQLPNKQTVHANIGEQCNFDSPHVKQQSVIFYLSLRIFQRNGRKLDKDLIFSGLVQNVYVYRMAKSKKI